MYDDYGYFCDPDTIESEPIILYPHVIIDNVIIPHKFINYNNTFPYVDIYIFQKYNMLIKIKHFVYKSVPDLCKIIYTASTVSCTKLYNRFRGFRL